MRRRWLQPSLVRRLVLAQMLTAGLMWLGLSAFVSYQVTMDAGYASLSQMRAAASLVLPLSEALERQPQALAQSLQHFDEYVRTALIPEDTQTAGRLVRLYLWRDDRLVFNGSGMPPPGLLPKAGELSRMTLKGQPWLAWAETSADGRSKFLALTPASTEASELTPWSLGWLVEPLLVSLPLLILPAWLTVRFALRPLSRLSHEIGERAANKLSPLREVSRHVELRALGVAMNGWLARLRKSRDRERGFLADAAHELRTPIAAMQVHAQALSQRGLPEPEQALVDGLLASNLRAGRLASQLLAMARSDALPALGGDARIDLEALLQASLAQWEPIAHARHIELSLDSCAATVAGQEEALRMLTDNLIGNAIKYSPDGSCVQVRLEHVAGTALLTVQDSGPGIPLELRDRVFDRFYRVPGQTQSGSGLGLAIVRAVAQAHGADISLEDGDDGLGLRVRVQFPALDETTG